MFKVEWLITLACTVMFENGMLNNVTRLYNIHVLQYILSHF